MTTHTSEIAPSYIAAPRKGRVSRRAPPAQPAEPPKLRDASLFSQIDEATLSRLSLDAKVESYEDGDSIFRQGDAIAHLTVVLRGYVKLLRIAASGDETLIGIRADGETIGETPMRADEVHSLSAEAVGPTTALKLPAARFARLVKESPALCAAVIQDAKDRIACLIGEVESLKGQNADQRLARFILSLCPAGEEQCRFRLPYDKRLVAARLGVKQETLSRAFAKLRDYGVRTETRHVHVESVSRLARQCDQLGRASRPPAERRKGENHDDAA